MLAPFATSSRFVNLPGWRDALSGVRAMFAAGAVLVGPTGKRSVSSSGKALVKNDSDDCPDCGCGEPPVTCDECSHCVTCGKRYPGCATATCWTPNKIRVTISGVTECKDCILFCSTTCCTVQTARKYEFPSVNGTFDLLPVPGFPCAWKATLGAYKEYFKSSPCGTPISADCDGMTLLTNTTMDIVLERQSGKWVFEIGPPGVTFFSGQYLTGDNGCTDFDIGAMTNTKVEPCRGAPVGCDGTPPCPQPSSTTPAFYGGSASFEVCPGSAEGAHVCCPCTHCAGCSEANMATCDGQLCCAPSVLRATVSGVTDCIGQCVTRTGGTIESYKLTGATAINRTIDLRAISTTECVWRGTVAADHVLKRATKHSLSTLRYRLTKTSATNWYCEVQAENAGASQVVKFFDGNVTVASNNCSSAATANNGLSCNLCGATKGAGSSGTFQLTPALTGSGTACSNCASLVPFTPTTIDVTVAGVTTCAGTCECTNRYKLTGSTTPNRTITLSQTSACVWQGTVAGADWILYDHDTAAATFNIDTIRYELNRTGATTATWEIAGYQGTTKRISYAGATSGSCALSAMSLTPSANNCKTWPTASHPARTCCVGDFAESGIFGSGGSTTFTACPA